MHVQIVSIQSWNETTDSRRPRPVVKQTLRRPTILQLGEKIWNLSLGQYEYLVRGPAHLRIYLLLDPKDIRQALNISFPLTECIAQQSVRVWCHPRQQTIVSCETPPSEIMEDQVGHEKVEPPVTVVGGEDVSSLEVDPF